MNRVIIKSGDVCEEKYLTDRELVTWFKSNSDAQGNVKSEIVLFEKTKIKKELLGDKKRYRFTFSDFTLDRDMERIDPMGAQLERYIDNPVILWGHENWRPAIGKAENVGKNEQEVFGYIVFDPNDQFAVMIESKIENGFISCGSIGFMPKTIEIVEDREKPERLIHRTWELLEFSPCNVPANPNARRRDIDDDFIKEIARQTGQQVASEMTPALLNIFGKSHSESITNNGQDSGGKTSGDDKKTEKGLTIFFAHKEGE